MLPRAPGEVAQSVKQLEEQERVLKDSIAILSQRESNLITRIGELKLQAADFEREHMDKMSAIMKRENAVIRREERVKQREVNISKQLRKQV